LSPGTRESPPTSHPHALARFGLSLLVTVAALALTRLTWPIFIPTPYAPLFAAVAISTHWGSGAAGLLTIALGSAGAATMLPNAGAAPWWAYGILGFAAVGLIGNRLIAARNKANAALHASEAQLRATLAHLRESEEALRRAQKIEAVGQLAAGVAHNFNNLLTVTMGYAEVLDDPAADGEMRRTASREIRRATDRGATLARQMLAFGRRHDPRVTNVSVDRTLADLRDMLRRVIREDITLTVHPGANRGVLIDPHDFEQVIFTLAINARDALPDGGDIVVDTSIEIVAANDPRRDPAAPPGEYVCVRVRDNGVGMSADVQAHLFEPFFTTKDVGEGTGLGLAFVHGIARHGGGFVAVDSAPGGGTTISVYLPPVAPAAVVEAPSPKPVPRPVVLDATILLVEDEDAVRRMTSQMLTRSGYRVLAAATPGEARELFARYRSEIDLLLTDVVMPEMHGPELADLLLADRPDLPVLFVSGYSDAMPSRGSAVGSRRFLAKPFTITAVTGAIAELLPVHSTDQC
jgi:two-component system, cell cycle sensor histidine kinase and response regulator CckA